MNRISVTISQNYPAAISLVFRFHNIAATYFSISYCIKSTSLMRYFGNSILVILWIALLSVQCAFIPQKPFRDSRPVYVIPKQFPDGSPYYIFYRIPDYFPPDIPLYERGQVQKVFVYDERDMDLIFRTTDTIEEIVAYFAEESEKRDWTIERITIDPQADHREITLPLRYDNHFVETLHYFAYRGHIFTAIRGNRVMVCRIMQIADSPYTIIVQQIRTES